MPFDPKVWDPIDEFESDQAAFLWCELEPSTNHLARTGRVLAIMNMLYRAAESGQLCPSRETGGSVSWPGQWDDFIGGGSRNRIFEPPTAYYSRAALRKFAESIGQRPVFLFPEDRASNAVTGKPRYRLPEKCDEWAEIIDACAREFERDEGSYPTGTQVWIRLLTKPPAGYQIERTAGDSIKTGSGSELERTDFMRRWERGTAYKRR
ncbi:hypothetical protein EWI61_00080 [Methylolobus aquaticus]|nr:hypothetical protein EWI61_00080 [Methylolobus aquaticus]